MRTIFLLLFFLALLSNQALAQLYFGPGIGYARYSTEKLDASDLVSAGPRYGFIAGYHFQPLPVALEGFYNYYKLKTDKIDWPQNGEQYVYHSNIKSGGILGKYFFGNGHVRLGYAIHGFNTYIINPRTGHNANNRDVELKYGVEGKRTYSGMLFGAGYDIPLQFISPYIVLTSYQLNNTTSDIFEIELGLKFKF